MKNTLVVCRGSRCITLLGCICLVGCGRGGDLQPTATVSGVVTYRGQPVPSGRIQFVPDARGPGVRTAFGLLDSQGRYTLSTYGNGDGAIVGTHRVGIVARQPTTGPVNKEAVAAGLVPDVPSLIPNRYASPGTSGLRAEVQPDSNTINFELED